MTRVALVCPGRGSYAERELRSLDAHGDHPWIARADALRRERGLVALTELDRAARFSAALHLKPANAAPLIWLVTMLDARAALEAPRVRPVVAVGNSMGWYTALAVADALSFDDGFRLVQEMALLQEEQQGGQLLYPTVGDDWRPDPERAAAVARALAEANGEAFPSIDLGGYAVLAGSTAGVAALARALPPVALGKNRYPLKLVGHGPYHTPLCAGVAQAARERLADLAFRRPRFPLVDGRGVRHTPWSTDLDELRAYTLGAQVVTPYDFTRSLAVALHEYAPDELVLPGPGNTLGGTCGQVLVRTGWRNVRSRADFDALQKREPPFVRSLRR